MSFGLEPLVDVDDVRIATLAMDDLPRAMYAILKMLLFDETQEPRFLSLTRCGQTLTLVADAPRLASVPGLSIDDTEWAVIHVDEQHVVHDGVDAGDFGENLILSMPGIIARLTGPLAAQQIPVFHLSTYDSEFILVPRARLDDALACFSGQHAPMPSAAATANPFKHTYPLEVLEQNQLSILRLEKRFLSQHTGALLRLLFLPLPGDPAQALVSVTDSPDNDLSLLCTPAPWWREHCDGLPDGLSGVDFAEWVPICVRDAELNETGIVAAMASVLSAQRISILGCSTLSGGGDTDRLATDFTLVPRTELERAKRAFQEAGFEMRLALEQGEEAAADSEANGAAERGTQWPPTAPAMPPR